MSRNCAIPDCGKPTDSRGWCATHYTRWRRHGDPLIVASGPGVFKAVSPAYFTKHSRVKRLRGSASQHLCGGCCGSRAREWATIRGRDGRDVFADYVPLCARCHHEYDAQHLKRARGSANGQARLSEAEVTEIKAALRAGQAVAGVARDFGKGWTTIDSIKAGRNWRHVS